jgi:hypothetical protein
MEIIEITDDEGVLVAPDRLAKALPVHKQLRPQLEDLQYEIKMRRVFAQGGRMCVAVRGDSVVGLAVYRMYENTADGRLLYVDDLVTDDGQRSEGVGHALLQHLEQRARRHDREMISLDSGVHRARAHKFYFREEMAISSYHFRKLLS